MIKIYMRLIDGVMEIRYKYYLIKLKEVKNGI